MGFRSLQHMRNRGSTTRGLCLPASFRLQGLATLVTVYSPRFRAGFVSHRQRSWDSPFGAFSSRKVSNPFPGWKAPHTVSPDGIPSTEVRGRLDRPQFLGFRSSRESLATGMCLAHRPLAAPLGFLLPGFSVVRLDPDFARSPLTRFPTPALAGIAAPQSLNRRPPRPGHPCGNHMA